MFKRFDPGERSRTTLTPELQSSANTSKTSLGLLKRPTPLDEHLVSSFNALPDQCGWNELSKLSSAEIEKSLDIVSTLGHGSMGLVDEVKGPNNDKVSFVRKRVFLPPFKRTQILKIVKYEAKVVEGLVHTHIVHIIDTYEHTPKSGMPSFSLLMFPVGDGDLTRFLHDTSSQTFSDDEANALQNIEARSWLTRWFSCLTSALAYIHAQGIRHQDIKPSNIIHLKDHIFFTDFSSSSRFDPGSTTSTENPARASARYSAPEVLERWDDRDGLNRHGTGSDIFALGCVFIEMLAVIAGTSPEDLQQYLQQAKSGGLFRFKKPALPPGSGFCYSHLVSGAESFFKGLSRLVYRVETMDEAVFFKKVIAPMLRHDRKRRPSALEVASSIEESNMITSCDCGHAYLPGSKEIAKTSQPVTLPIRLPPSSSPPIPMAELPAKSVAANPPIGIMNLELQSEQLAAFKDYYSTDEIHPGDYVSTLWAYQPRNQDEFELERGDMFRIIGIWDDGWATATRFKTRAEEFDWALPRQKDESPPFGEIKMVALVCVCLPQHWRKTIEEGEADTVVKPVIGTAL